MKKDEAIQWIRDVRSIISHELQNDPHKFLEFHKNLRSKYKRVSEPLNLSDRDSAIHHTDRR
jgi:hypothetical protein